MNAVNQTNQDLKDRNVRKVLPKLKTLKNTHRSIVLGGQQTLGSYSQQAGSYGSYGSYGSATPQ